jgi:hypothetical protein
MTSPITITPAELPSLPLDERPRLVEGVVEDAAVAVAPSGDAVGLMEPTVIPAKETARLLRAEVKDRYPGARVSVRLSSGGRLSHSLDVDWAAGPSIDEMIAVAWEFIGIGYRGYEGGDGGEYIDLPGRWLGAVFARYDVHRIELTRWKADGSLDASRLLHVSV